MSRESGDDWSNYTFILKNITFYLVYLDNIDEFEIFVILSNASSCLRCLFGFLHTALWKIKIKYRKKMLVWLKTQLEFDLSVVSVVMISNGN